MDYLSKQFSRRLWIKFFLLLLLFSPYFSQVSAAELTATTTYFMMGRDFSVTLTYTGTDVERENFKKPDEIDKIKFGIGNNQIGPPNKERRTGFHEDYEITDRSSPEVGGENIKLTYQIHYNKDHEPILDSNNCRSFHIKYDTFEIDQKTCLLVAAPNEAPVVEAIHDDILSHLSMTLKALPKEGIEYVTKDKNPKLTPGEVVALVIDVDKLKFLSAIQDSLKNSSIIFDKTKTKEADFVRGGNCRFSEDKIAKIGSDRDLDKVDNCLICDNTNAYLDYVSLKKQEFFKKYTQKKNLRTNGRLDITIDEEDLGTAFLVALFYPKGLKRSACHRMQAGENVSISDLNGEEAATRKTTACFIATAAYGSLWNAHLDDFRWFRDHILENVSLGREFIHWYYRTSPSYASWLEGQPVWRWAVRQVLTPFSYSIRFLRFTLVHPVFLAFFLVLLLVSSVLLVKFLDKRRKK